MHNNRYLVAIDGTQKYVMKECWDERYLFRRIQGKDGEWQYYAYVLEAVLVFANSMVLPLMSEFLENSEDAGFGIGCSCRQRCYSDPDNK